MHKININWNSGDSSQFWNMADLLQEQTVELAGDLFAFVERAAPDELNSILIQYRFFTVYYIPDIAILIARLQDGKLRSFMADVLFDELGRGDPAGAHPRLYDDFLRSLNSQNDELDSLALADNIDILDSTRSKLVSSNTSSAYSVGLRGMGGECVCQIYLARLYEHLIKNPFIQQNRPSIDWRFWDLHIGEHDIAHRLTTRQLINEEIIQQGNEAISDLGLGYQESMHSWGDFWNNVLASATSSDVRRTRISSTFEFQPAALSAGISHNVTLN
ncbi:iron-containing redox enzyme family protein [Paraburkholderia hayleyella]|uniref:iron-containing redox enzyme family protein n=1 Tax=Paraburkholderia hayleyella TaxID=2152889 RepID=UPI001290C5B8|nr:iron-containing redox enzyme family protein [Paraburkholderia hayleyella]